MSSRVRLLFVCVADQLSVHDVGQAARMDSGELDSLDFHARQIVTELFLARKLN